MTQAAREQRLLLAEGRVFLCHPAESDLDDFVSTMKRSRALHGAWVQAPDTPDLFRSFLEKDPIKNASLLVCLRENAKIVGVINLNEMVLGGFRSTYLGYYGTSDFAGQGLMAEGMRLALRFGFETLSLHRAEANIQPSNTASIALVRRLGFRKEGFSPRYLKIDGEWRDHERWAFLSDDRIED